MECQASCVDCWHKQRKGRKESRPWSGQCKQYDCEANWFRFRYVSLQCWVHKVVQEQDQTTSYNLKATCLSLSLFLSFLLSSSFFLSLFLSNYRLLVFGTAPMACLHLPIKGRTLGSRNFTILACEWATDGRQPAPLSRPSYNCGSISLYSVTKNMMTFP